MNDKPRYQLARPRNIGFLLLFGQLRKWIHFKSVNSPIAILVLGFVYTSLILWLAINYPYLRLPLSIGQLALAYLLSFGHFEDNQNEH